MDAENKNKNLCDDNTAKKQSKTPIIVSLSVMLVILIAVCAIIIVRSNSPEKRLQAQLDLGYKYLEELDYEQAIAAFVESIEIDPKNTDAYYGLIEAYICLGKYEEAINAYMEASNAVEKTDLLVLQNRLTDYLLLNIENARKNSDRTLEDSLRNVLLRINPGVLGISESIEDNNSIVDAGDQIETIIANDESEIINLDSETDNSDTVLEDDSVSEDTEEMSDVAEMPNDIEETVVGGIIHNAYNYYPLTDDEKSVLESYITLCAQGNIKSASDKLDDDKLSGLVFKYNENTWNNGNFDGHFVCGEYKFFIRIFLGEQSHSYTMYILPIKSGNGFLIYKNIRLNKIEFVDSETLIGYTCGCSNGMFNGSLRGNEWVRFYPSGEGFHQMTGNVKNGLLDGEYTFVMGIGEYSTTYSTVCFANGIPTNPYYDYLGAFGAGTQYTEFQGVKSGTESIALLLVDGWERRYFYLEPSPPYSGHSGTEGTTQNGGLFIYPY